MSFALITGDRKRVGATIAVALLALVHCASAQHPSASYLGRGPDYPAPYSSDFKQPQPPSIVAEFSAAFMQHKWDNRVSHITTGMLYNSPSNLAVRADNTYNTTLQSSLFNFATLDKSGLVNNTIYGASPNPTKFRCESYRVPPAIPLFTANLLKDSGAVYIGVTNDDLHGPVSGWQLLFGPSVIVTAYLDREGTFVRYDFSAPGAAGGNLRTFTTTRFFNIVQGRIPAAVFKTPC